MRLTTYSKCVKEAAYRRGWSRVWGSIKGGIYLIPSETTRIVVQTLPDLKISCVLPATKRRLGVSLDKKKIIEVDVNTPTLLLQQVLPQTPYHCYDFNCTECKGHNIICFCESCMLCKKKYGQGNPKTLFLLYELVERGSGSFPDKYSVHTDIFFIRPYRIGNVDSQAFICIGGQDPTPTLRQANFNFWNSSFNNDYSEIYENKSHNRQLCKNKHNLSFHDAFGLQIEHVCSCLDTSDSHRDDCLCPEACNCACQCVCCLKSCNCFCDCDENEAYAKLVQGYIAETTDFRGAQSVCGTSFMASSKYTEGVFISYDAELISKIPIAARSTTKKGVAAIGLALLTKYGEWQIDFKAGYSNTFTENEVYLV